MALNKYRSKRNFKTTPEPPGSAVVLKEKSATAGLRFVIQLHDATRKHYDLRLELDGTMKSWAVPKGPSLDPMERRLAVEVEDHPMEYNEFEGVIPKGHYGAGVVMIWDEGLYRARSVEFPAKDDEDALRRGFAKGHMTFILEGKKLQGEFALIRLAKGDGHSWLLVKKRDAHSTRDDITFADRSVRSGRTLGDIAVNAQVEGKIWDSRPKKATPHLANANPPLPKGESKALAPRFKKGAKPAGDPKTLKLTLWHPAKADDDGNGLIFHPLYDGYHVLVIMRPQCAVQLSSRTGLSLTKRFSKLAEDLAAVQRSLVLDGLVVPLDAEGQPRGRGRLEAHAVPHYALFVYDLLEADGLDLRHLPLKERLAAFKQINVTTESLRATQAMSPEDRTGAAAISYGALLRALDEA